MAGKKPKKEEGGLSLAEIAAAVERDSKGQTNAASRLEKGDVTVAYELIAVAIYKAFRRRSGNHVDSLEATKKVIDATDIRVVLG